jgi:hypothetical protein
VAAEGRKEGSRDGATQPPTPRATKPPTPRLAGVEAAEQALELRVWG